MREYGEGEYTSTYTTIFKFYFNNKETRSYLSLSKYYIFQEIISEFDFIIFF